MPESVRKQRNELLYFLHKIASGRHIVRNPAIRDESDDVLMFIEVCPEQAPEHVHHK